MTVVVQHRIVKCKHIDYFRARSGRRRIGMPFWVVTTGGAFVFDYISEHTNARQLADLIDAGRVYIREEDSKIYEDEHQNTLQN